MLGPGGRTFVTPLRYTNCSLFIIGAFLLKGFSSRPLCSPSGMSQGEYLGRTCTAIYFCCEYTRNVMIINLSQNDPS